MIKVYKKERKLLLIKNGKTINSFPISLGFDQDKDKTNEGDGATPCGRFYIWKKVSDPKNKDRYGARILSISYPNIEDAKRGLSGKLINKHEYDSIVKSHTNYKKTKQSSRLGGE